MEQKKIPTRRKVDDLAANVSKNWRKKIIHVTKRQVSTWKGLMVIFFAFGILAGVIWTVSINRQSKSSAATGFAKLTWNANTESDLAGYTIYYGTTPRTGTCPANGGYANKQDVGNVTSYTLSNLTEGSTYYFSVTAYDTSKNESCFSSEQSKLIPVTVVADIQSPIVAIASPAANSTISGTSNVTATASDNTSITKVDFYVDGTLKSTTTTSPYVYALDTTQLTDGTHTLLAKAYDAVPNIGTSASVSVNVKNIIVVTDTVAPTVTIISPANGATVSGTVAIKATAMDNVLVTGMACYVDGVKGTTSTNGNIACSWNTRKVTSGAHTIKVEANDAAGNVGTSTVSVNIGSSGGGKPPRK